MNCLSSCVSTMQLDVVFKTQNLVLILHTLSHCAPLGGMEPDLLVSVMADVNSDCEG